MTWACLNTQRVCRHAGNIFIAGAFQWLFLSCRFIMVMVYGLVRFFNGIDVINIVLLNLLTTHYDDVSGV